MSEMQDTSLSLLDRAANSTDEEAWSRLVGIYTPLLRRWLKRYNVAEADSDDLVQDVLAVILRELPSFDHNRHTGAFRNWLRRVLVFRLRNHWRSRDAGPHTPGGSGWLERLEQLEDDNGDLSRDWNAEHDRYVLERLMELVRPRFQGQTWEAFRRQTLEGQRASDVAAELRMPLSSVYVARSRVLTALRREAAGLVDPA